LAAKILLKFILKTDKYAFMSIKKPKKLANINFSPIFVTYFITV